MRHQCLLFVRQYTHCRILEGFSGPYPPYGWDFPEETPEKFRKDPETLSERFLEFASRVRLGSPKPYNSRHLRLPEHSQNSIPSFFTNGSGEGLSELVMEFPSALRVLLIQGSRIKDSSILSQEQRVLTFES